jgi:hypothetical protein
MINAMFFLSLVVPPIMNYLTFEDAVCVWCHIEHGGTIEDLIEIEKSYLRNAIIMPILWIVFVGVSWYYYRKVNYKKVIM